MNKMQKELRRAAVRSFMESLNELETQLGSEEEQTPPDSRKNPSPSNPPQFDVGDFEAAVADIEQNTRPR
ncbi:hypothetical protein [Vacuolonema iberomarrocanum]|uniref:hypothetical protein n=1 Tax=Vacuolonema iberomarrocanum TaxID=3454632 RepID=UPI0019F7C2C8|nr:hypothetical protein [filamentous cyanobacterium LEGE 07170]